MKNKIFYLFILIMVAIGCQDKTVGYLFVDEAEYPIDSIEIYRNGNFKSEKKILQEKVKKFSDAAGQTLVDYLALEPDYNRLTNVKQKKSDIVTSAYNEYYTYISDEGYDQIVADKLKEVADKLDSEFYDWDDEVFRPVRKKFRNWGYDLDDIAEATFPEEELRLDDIFNINEQIALIDKRLSGEIPWTTSTIGGVLGTQPMNYEILNVSSTTNGADVTDFRKYLKVIGGGRMFVNPGVNSPSGRYVVSLRVYNQGQSKDLIDVFTFILK